MNSNEKRIFKSRRRNECEQYIIQRLETQVTPAKTQNEESPSQHLQSVHLLQHGSQFNSQNPVQNLANLQNNTGLQNYPQNSGVLGPGTSMMVQTGPSAVNSLLPQTCQKCHYKKLDNSKRKKERNNIRERDSGDEIRTKKESKFEKIKETKKKKMRTEKKLTESVVFEEKGKPGLGKREIILKRIGGGGDQELMPEHELNQNMKRRLGSENGSVHNQLRNIGSLKETDATDLNSGNLFQAKFDLIESAKSIRKGESKEFHLASNGSALFFANPIEKKENQEVNYSDFTDNNFQKTTSNVFSFGEIKNEKPLFRNFQPFNENEKTVTDNFSLFSKTINPENDKNPISCVEIPSSLFSVVAKSSQLEKQVGLFNNKEELTDSRNTVPNELHLFSEPPLKQFVENNKPSLGIPFQFPSSASIFNSLPVTDQKTLFAKDNKPESPLENGLGSIGNILNNDSNFPLQVLKTGEKELVSKNAVKTDLNWKPQIAFPKKEETNPFLNITNPPTLDSAIAGISSNRLFTNLPSKKADGFPEQIQATNSLFKNDTNMFGQQNEKTGNLFSENSLQKNQDSVSLFGNSANMFKNSAKSLFETSVPINPTFEFQAKQPILISTELSFPDTSKTTTNPFLSSTQNTLNSLGLSSIPNSAPSLFSNPSNNILSNNLFSGQSGVQLQFDAKNAIPRNQNNIADIFPTSNNSVLWNTGNPISDNFGKNEISSLFSSQIPNNNEVGKNPSMFGPILFGNTKQ